MALAIVLIACGGDDTDTADVTLSSDIRIDGAPGNKDPESGGTKMCVNNRGEIYVTWIDDRDGTVDVWATASLDFGINWLLTPVKVNRGIDNQVWNVEIACNDEGAYVVWEDDRDGELQNHNIYFSRTMDGGQTWLPDDVLLELDEDGDSMSQGPQIESVGSDLYVVWYDNLNGAADIILAASGDNGTGWRDPVRVDQDLEGEAFSGSPKIAASETGRVYVVWEDTRDGNSDIWFNRSDNAGSSFETPDIRLDGGDDAGNAFSFAPTISADGDNVYVIWHDARNGEGRDVFLNYTSNGGQDWYNSAVRVDTDAAGFFNSIFPRIKTIDNVGHAAWQDNRDGGYDIYYRQFIAGEGGAEEVRIDLGSEPGFANSTDTVLAANDNGKLVVAWEDQRGDNDSDNGFNDLYYTYPGDDGAFPEADLRIDSLAPGASFKLDVNVYLHNTQLFTAWTDGRAGTADVYFKSLELGKEGDFIEGDGPPSGGVN
jgi:hypothetical protein